MRVDLLLSRPASPVFAEMVQTLTDRGATVREIRCDRPDTAPPASGTVDLCITKAKTPEALDLAEAYDAAGVVTFNPSAVTRLCRDKVRTTDVLEAAGLPLPATFTADRPRGFAELLADGPIIVKPVQGSQGAGVVVVEDVDELDRLDREAGDDPLLAQRYLRPDGRDRKIYRIGDEVFCVERIWPPTSMEDKLGRIVTLPPHVEQIARDCGSALGIDTYGVDVIEHQGEPWVVDLSSFPGFKGVPHAGRRLADHVLGLFG